MIDIEKAVHAEFEQLVADFKPPEERTDSDFVYCSFLLGYIGAVNSKYDPKYKVSLDLDFSTNITQIALEYFPDFEEKYNGVKDQILNSYG